MVTLTTYIILIYIYILYVYICLLSVLSKYVCLNKIPYSLFLNRQLRPPFKTMCLSERNWCVSKQCKNVFKFLSTHLIYLYLLMTMIQNESVKLIDSVQFCIIHNFNLLYLFICYIYDSDLNYVKTPFFCIQIYYN